MCILLHLRWRQGDIIYKFLIANAHSSISNWLAAVVSWGRHSQMILLILVMDYGLWLHVQAYALTRYAVGLGSVHSNWSLRELVFLLL